MLLDQWRAAESALAGMAAFEAAIAQDPFRTVPGEHLLARLGGADVLLMFVESYGRSALELPRYAETLVPTLEAFEQRLAERGLVAASGWLTSPTVGGQSWLAHGTLRKRPVARRSGPLPGADPERAAHPDPRVRPGRLSHDRAQAGDHPPVARGRAPRLREDLCRGRPGLSRQAVQLGHHARPVHAGGARAGGARGRRAPPVRGGLADQQPCALDADRAGAGGLVRDRRRQRVLQVGGRGRPAGGGVARPRAGARAICPGDRLRARACSRPTRRTSSTRARS